jgi:hypothetical protein
MQHSACKKFATPRMCNTAKAQPRRTCTALVAPMSATVAPCPVLNGACACRLRGRVRCNPRLPAAACLQPRHHKQPHHPFGTDTGLLNLPSRHLQHGQQHQRMPGMHVPPATTVQDQPQLLCRQWHMCYTACARWQCLRGQQDGRHVQYNWQLRAQQ